jgi:hypothetical protein
LFGRCSLRPGLINYLIRATVRELLISEHSGSLHGKLSEPVEGLPKAADTSSCNLNPREDNASDAGGVKIMTAEQCSIFLNRMSLS